MILSLGVRYFRCPCCEDLEHCTNPGRGGYRRGMLNDLIGEQCSEDRHVMYKVASPCELLSLKVSWRKIRWRRERRKKMFERHRDIERGR